MVVKVTLFRSLLHINVARKVAAMHSMRWQQLFLRYFWVPLFLICSWCTSLSLEFLGRSPWLLEYIFELYLSYPRRNSSSDHLPLLPYLWDSKLESPITVYSSSNHYVLGLGPKPKIWFGPLTLHILLVLLILIWSLYVPNSKANIISKQSWP